MYTPLSFRNFSLYFFAFIKINTFNNMVYISEYRCPVRSERAVRCGSAMDVRMRSSPFSIINFRHDI